MAIQLLRAAFILLTVSVTLLYVLSYQYTILFAGGTHAQFGMVFGMFGIALGTALFVVGIDVSARKKRLSSLSGVFLGLIAGLVAAFAMGFVVDLIGLLFAPEINFQLPATPGEYELLSPADKTALSERDAFLDLLEGTKVLIGLITCYLGISLVMQTKDDFRFVIPYVEFAKEVRGNRPTLVDTSIIIDGRVMDIMETRMIQGTLIIPRFVLNELQLISDSSDKLKRARGRRGLEILQKMQDSHAAQVIIEDVDVEGGTVDQKLVTLAQARQARVMTNDYNLNKIATLRGVDVINLNDLAKAMRPVVLPGEQMTVRIVKAGENPTQGVGYLDDGTMVVVENARQCVNKEVAITVTSTLQTSAGRMIFGRNETVIEDERASKASQRSGVNLPAPESTGHEPEGQITPPTSGDEDDPHSAGGAPPPTKNAPRSGRGGRASARNPRRSH